MKEIRHIGLYVNNLDIMMNFYKNVFNMKVVINQVEESQYIQKVLGVDGIKVHIIKLKADDGAMIELLKCNIEENMMEDKRLYTYGLSHIAITVEDLSKTFVELKNMGLKYISEPTISTDNYAKVCFFQDPEGNFLELVEVLGGN